MMFKRELAAGQRGSWSALLLLRRTFLTLGGGWLNIGLFVVQPLLIALLITVVAVGDSSIPKKLFLGLVASLWLGCSNAAQVIVKERAIFLRERLAGLRIHAYLGAKFVAMGLITFLQVLAIYGILYFTGAGLVGSAPIQLAALAGGALALSGIGIFVSALSRDQTQSILSVPIIIIPQILFGGYIFTIDTWEGRPFVSLANRACPSYSAQKLIDISFLWNRKADWDYLNRHEIGTTGYLNIQASTAPASAWLWAETRRFRVPEAEKAEYLQMLRDSGEIEIPFPSWNAYLNSLRLQAQRAQGEGSGKAPEEVARQLEEWSLEKARTFSIPASEKAAYYRDLEAADLKDEEFIWPLSFPRLNEGTYHHRESVATALACLAGWIAVSYVASWIALSRAA